MLKDSVGRGVTLSNLPIRSMFVPEKNVQGLLG